MIARNRVAHACACALLGMGLMHEAWALNGGQGGQSLNPGGYGGASAAGGGGAELTYNGSSSAGGTGGVGGNGRYGPGSLGGNGGPGGGPGLLATANTVVSSTVSGLPGTPGTGTYGGSGGGGGGGGDGIYASAGVNVTVGAGILVKGGTGAVGGPPSVNGLYYAGGSGGGGHGVEFGGAGGMLQNAGTIYGGNGGSSTLTTMYGCGGGGGHGVIGAGITIANSGQILGGPKGTASNPVADGGTGDAVAFIGGVNRLALAGSSSITGDIELADNTTARIYAQDAGQTLGGGAIVLDGAASVVEVSIAAQDLTIARAFTGPGALKVGTGGGAQTLVLSGANAHTGGSTVYAGTMRVDSTLGDVVVAGGTLAGNGSVGAITLNSGGTVAPGRPLGALNAGSLAWNGGGAFAFQLGATNSSSDNDQLALTGALSKGSAGTYKFHFSDGNGAPKVGVTYTLLTFGSYTGFTPSDFSYDYIGANPGLIGTFALMPTSLTFTPTSLKATTATQLATPCMTTFVENQPFTLDASTTGAAPTGSITFADGALTLCSNVPLSGNTASCTSNALVLQSGNVQSVYHVSASYGGDGNNTASVSAPLTVTVLSAAEVVYRDGFEVGVVGCPVE